MLGTVATRLRSRGLLLLDPVVDRLSLLLLGIRPLISVHGADAVCADTLAKRTTRLVVKQPTVKHGDETRTRAGEPVAAGQSDVHGRLRVSNCLVREERTGKISLMRGDAKSTKLRHLIITSRFCLRLLMQANEVLN